MYKAVNSHYYYYYDFSFKNVRFIGNIMLGIYDLNIVYHLSYIHYIVLTIHTFIFMYQNRVNNLLWNMYKTSYSY